MAETGVYYRREWMFAITSVMVGCCSNLVFLEMLVKESPGCGNLITFAQFAFVALLSLPRQIEMRRGGGTGGGEGGGEGGGGGGDSGTGTWMGMGMVRLRQRQVPLSEWVQVVSLFFIVNLLNNLVFQFKISMPFHIIFRSASLLISLLFGFLYFRRSYALTQVAGVILVTLGVILCTLATVPSTTTTPTATNSSQATQSAAGGEKTGEGDEPGFLLWLLGVGLLTAGLILSCVLGIKQELVYNKYGKVPQEGLFYVHALSFPAFVFFIPDLLKLVTLFSQSEPFELFGLPVSILGFTAPRLWVYLLLNVSSQ